MKEKKETSQEIYEPYMRKGHEDRKRYEIVRGRRIVDRTNEST